MTEEPQPLLKSKRLRLVFLLAFSKAKIFLDFSEVVHTKIACKSKDYRVGNKIQILVANSGSFGDQNIF